MSDARARNNSGARSGDADASESTGVERNISRRELVLGATASVLSVGHACRAAPSFGTAHEQEPTSPGLPRAETSRQLLDQEQNGREIYYSINAKQMKEVADFIEPFRKMWDDRFNKLESIMKKYKTKK